MTLAACTCTNHSGGITYSTNPWVTLDDGAEMNTKTGPFATAYCAGMLRTAPDRETFGARTATSVLIGGFADKDRHLLFVHSL